MNTEKKEYTKEKMGQKERKKKRKTGKTGSVRQKKKSKIKCSLNKTDLSERASNIHSVSPFFFFTRISTIHNGK